VLNVHLTTLQTVGLAAVLTGVVILLFSPYRRWLGFMLAGMGYFTFLEAVQYVTHISFEWSVFQGYIAGLALSLGMLTVWLSATEKKRTELRLAQRLARQVEHRPIRMQELSPLETDH
jgi:uncharacterized membrane protein